jgi:hypothetical protein
MLHQSPHIAAEAARVATAACRMNEGDDDDDDEEYLFMGDDEEEQQAQLAVLQAQMDHIHQGVLMGGSRLNVL